MAGIWKYPLTRITLNKVDMPLGSKLLHAAFQQNQLTMWVMVEADVPLVRRHIFVVMTGEQVPPGVYFATAVNDAQNFVFHLFDQGEHQTIDRI